jgi:hypothetical protein
MKILTMLSFLGAVTTLNAQSLPDCRIPNLPIGAQCNYIGTTLPVQKTIGDISLPSSDQVRMTEPLGTSAIEAPVAGGHAFTVGGLFTVQTETLGYKRYVSGGFKGTGSKQWSDWRGLEVRGSAIEFGLGFGIDAGNNHTIAIAAGPRIEHTWGRVTPYGEALVGFLHQYYYGMSESGVFGASLRLSDRLSFVPADVEYRYASLQDSTVLRNPRRGRIELTSGMVYRFGASKATRDGHP